MTTMLALPKHSGLRFCLLFAACALAATTLAAQKPVARIVSEIAPGNTDPIKVAAGPWAQPQFDAGRVPADTRLTSMTLVFNRTSAQQADLEALLAAQQNPSSPQYHQWLTPAQFGARFGMAQSDLNKVQTWLEQQGFKVDNIANSKSFIQFSGSVSQFELAFQTEMHYYQVQGEKHFAPSTALSVPAAIAPTVETLRDISDFKPHAFHLSGSRSAAHPNFTFYSGTNTQSVLFAPGDIKVAYDVKPLVTSSIDGTGQTIAVMGQSEITASDIENFESAAGLATKDPTLVLVPGSGSPAISSGDESESDLDVEWSGAMAPGANIDLVYTGNSANSNGVFDSIAFAIDSRIGDVISISYGSCETALGNYYTTMDPLFQEASTQGQTVIASSGDQGSTSCQGYPTTGAGALTTAQTLALAVNYPASSAYVTGVGGTEISAADDVVGPYWGPAPSQSTFNLTSALQWIPEVAWNDDPSSGPAGDGLSASGGGHSTIYTSKPSWQTGVPGIQADSKRDVPDIALYASPEFPGYLYCSSDPSAWSQGQNGTCSAGQFYDPNTFYFTVAGGTSFGAPIFAGMVALMNEKNKYTGGQGFLNTELYKLASNSTTYASAFHDVTSGNNFCTAGSASGDCASNGASLGFAAGTGYDMVTGLGSVDLNNLVTAWPTSTSTLAASITTVSASSSTPNSGASDEFTITVSPASGSGTPSGDVTLSIDGGGTTFNNGGSTQTVTLSGGVATYTTSFSTAGVHTIVAEYAGDSSFAASTGTATVTVSGSSSGTGSISLAATAVSVPQGSTGNSTITVTPAGGYTGTVGFQVYASSSELASNGCYAISNVVVTGTGAVTTTLQIGTTPTGCSGAALKGPGHRILSTGSRSASATSGRPGPRTIIPVTLAALLGFLFVGSRRRRSMWLNIVGCLLLLGVLGAAMGCGGGVTTTSNQVPKGTYTVTVTGTDTVTSSITSSTTFTLTVN